MFSEKDKAFMAEAYPCPDAKNTGFIIEPGLT
jgi:hypothetical protein